MNTTKRICAFALLLAMALPVIAATDSKLAEFSKIYQAYAQALKQKDLQTILKYETDDFTQKLKSGKTVSYQETTAGFRILFQIAKEISADAQVDAVKTDGTQATVFASEKVEYVVVDSRKNDHHVTETTKSKDIWVQVGGLWKIKFSEDLEFSRTVDGSANQ
jgi:hypothetical protein